MSWTDERVSRLAKLWAEGLSASQIAEDLGGVTRNAVIGKVHRLGLSGRDKPAGKSNAAARRKPAARPAAAASGNSSSNPTRPRTTTRTVGNTALKVEVEEEVIFQPKPELDLVVPLSRKLTLLELTEATCKWPTGDPTMPGFSFCGHTSKDDKPYCDYHNKLAFQPPNDRRRRR